MKILAMIFLLFFIFSCSPFKEKYSDTSDYVYSKTWECLALPQKGQGFGIGKNQNPKKAESLAIQDCQLYNQASECMLKACY